jgi:hypothetical protein
MNNNQKVTIYADPRNLLRKRNQGDYAIKPIVIKDGVVHTASNKQLSVEGGR